jgi:hypothetical protein
MGAQIYRIDYKKATASFFVTISESIYAKNFVASGLDPDTNYIFK